MRHIVKRYQRHIAFFFLINILAELIAPNLVLALTSGPSQPETQEFQAINVSDMVDLASGDFSYNLPLLEVDGYPVNLSYRGGTNMDQEATCIGLGWNMNVGSISRNMRGLPDDFNGDIVKKELNVKDNESYGVTVGLGVSAYGIDKIGVSGNASIGISYNSYTGYDFIRKKGFSISLGSHMSVGLGVTSSSDGLTISPNLSLQAKVKGKDSQTLNGSVSLGTSFGSRTGIKELSLGVGVSNSRTSNGNANRNRNGTGTVGAYNNGSSIMFGSLTYVPQITMPMHTRSFAASYKVGGTVYGLDGNITIAGNYSKQKLAVKDQQLLAYGYLNLDQGQHLENAMLDFNREKDGVFTEATPNLPVPNLTYDNYSVMGQGVGGSFRPFRSDVGYVFDPRASNTSESDNVGVEVHIGNVVEGGVDWINTTVDGTSGRWSDGNYGKDVAAFNGNGYTAYEKAYFKEMGEMNVDDDGLYNTIRNEKAARFQLLDQGNMAVLDKNLIDENSSTFGLSGSNQRSKRVKRNQLFSYLSVADCQYFALQPSLFSEFAKYANGNLTNGHHIGQITTTKTDGTRYVYGLPVYNHMQREVSFNVNLQSNASNYFPASNQVAYTPVTENSKSNTSGVDHFFTATELPAYTYAHLLTAVLSSDYVDVTGNGPTPDDIGSYTLFNYSPADAVKNYKWRAPLAPGGVANRATFDEGLMSNKNDGKGSYMYGTKDIYYLSSIEGKNHIALLNYIQRDDGKGVTDENGAFNGASYQRKLTTITLYSRQDYALKQSNPAHQPFIKKQVHFKHNYELFQGVYNTSNTTPGQTGKLTLEEVYFTYGNSGKGKLSPYRFAYYDKVNGSAVNYNPMAVDRWGNYKPNDINCPNSKFPYVEQNTALENQYVAVGNLKSIQLPSGGLMQIEYESDDYAFVQDKRAGEMFKIVGASKLPADGNAIGNNQLFNSTSPITGPGNVNDYLYFELKNNQASTDFINDYLADVDKLYFRFYVKVNCGSNQDHASVTLINNTSYPGNAGEIGYEFVNGYAEIDRTAGSWYGTMSANGKQYGYVKVKPVRQSKLRPGVEEHPVSKAAWQMARLFTSKDAYSCNSSNNPANGPTTVTGIIKAMADASFIKNTAQFFMGYNGTLKSQGYGQKFIPSLSWIRLSNPDYKKLGGGHRVKSIKIEDRWKEMLSTNPVNANLGSVYGQTYDYTTSLNGKTISSGVASYEPMIGADENPFRKPIVMDTHKAEALLAPDNNMFMEEPMGESFFPSPSVVYSKVSVKSIAAGSGKVVNEYYTARDFPTQVHALGMEAKRKKPNPIFKLFTFNAFDRFAGSQGYSIEVNDMHGKPKAVHLYEEGALAPKSSTIYRYRQNGNKLDNTVKVAFKDGSIKTSTLGVDYDFYADFRENNTTTEAIGVNANLYFIIYGIFPAFIPPVLPTYHREEVQLRTAVTNKVIYKYGILESVDNIYNGSLTRTSNLLYDSETGHVLLTGTTTEFKDPIYTTAYPGHWAYEALAGGYKNSSLRVAQPNAIVNTAGQITSQVYKSLLYPGDELALYPASGSGISAPQKGYVDQLGNSMYITLNGLSGGVQTSTPLDKTALGNYEYIEVIRSGRHNLQDQKIGAITSFTNPLYNNPSYWPNLNQGYGVTQATAVELGGAWQGYCGCSFPTGGTTTANLYPNQYVYGVKGNWRKLKDYTYLTQRLQTRTDGNSNIRVDGTFESFAPFWTPNSGNDWLPNPNNWQWVSEATRYSPYGFDLETKDALNRYSSAQYGYMQTQPVAVSSNSRYRQSANESFEYNAWNFCQDDHLGFNQHRANTYQTIGNGVQVQKYSHTGTRSIKVPATQTLTINKQINTCQ